MEAFQIKQMAVNKIQFYAMGCQMTVLLESSSKAAQACLEEVPGWFEIWEQSLSRFRPSSELNWLNRHSGEAVEVSTTLWEVLKLALRVAYQSGGLIVPTLLSELELAGYDQSFDRLSGTIDGPPATATLPLNRHGWKEIKLDPFTHRVTLPAGMRLDLSGVAKGWAAQKAMTLLKRYGPVLVDAGGDIAVSGWFSNGALWPIGVVNPFQPEETLDLLWVGKNGIATSGRDYRRWKKNGSWQHHIIDPRTGHPAKTDVLSATIIAPDVVEAEMAAKVVTILGSQEGIAWLEAHPEMAGLAVLENQRVIHSKNLTDYLWR